MFKNQVSRYISFKPGEQAKPFVDTKASYEFTMVALRVGTNWYVLVENADPSRLYDIDEVIRDEFDSDVIGWCSLKKDSQAESLVLAFSQGAANEDQITYHDERTSYWLLKIQPNKSSRLNALSAIAS